MNLRNLLLRDGNPQFRKHHFRRITIPRTGIHPSPQFPQQRHASLHHKRQHISTPSMVIMPWASAFHGVLGFMHPQSSCYNFISIHNKISKLVLHRQSSPFIPAFTLHNRLHPFLYFPPRLPQVYRPHKDAMPRLLIPIRKVEILIHGRVDQSSASIQSMRLAPVFLVHHVRKNLREMIPANLLPATKLRNQRLAVELGIKNKLLLRIRIEKRHVGFHSAEPRQPP